MSQAEPCFSWPTTGTVPLTQALLRAAPEDFVVEERMDIALTGSGEHLWLQLRKRGVNTDFVARQIARAAAVPARAVSYAGMKDRHALTTQWFSVHLPGRDVTDLAARLPAQCELIAMQRHARKLQRGALKGNRFRIVLRECSGDRTTWGARVAQVAQHGAPNYFGEQRFGRDGANVEQARAMFAGTPVRDRHLRGIYLSAARSLLFNDILARRVADGTWASALAGDVFVLDGSNSFFAPELIDDAMRQRLAAGDIHPSGALWGEGEPPSRDGVHALECEVARQHPPLARGLAAAGLAQERRALRLVPENLQARWQDDATLEISFGLRAGGYATAILREFASYRDVGGAGTTPDVA